MDAQAAGPTLDAALANGSRITLTFDKKAGHEIRELLKMGGVIVPLHEERGLEKTASFGGDTTCNVTVTLTGAFPANRKKFEQKVLKGVTALEIAA